MNRKKSNQPAPALFKVEQKPQPSKKDWQDSSKELRIRNFDPALKKELHEIMKLDKKKMPFESYAVEYLIRSYRQDQNLIKQLQQRNSQLHASLSKYVNAVPEMLELVNSFAVATHKWDKQIQRDTKEWSKRMKGTVKRPVTRSRAVPGTKTVPKKKGGEK